MCLAIANQAVVFPHRRAETDECSNKRFGAAELIDQSDKAAEKPSGDQRGSTGSGRVER